MQLYVIPIIMGLICGLLAAFLWVLFWTVVIPWPAHEISLASWLSSAGSVPAFGP